MDLQTKAAQVRESVVHNREKSPKFPHIREKVYEFLAKAGSSEDKQKKVKPIDLISTIDHPTISYLSYSLIGLLQLNMMGEMLKENRISMRNILLDTIFPTSDQVTAFCGGATSYDITPGHISVYDDPDLPYFYQKVSENFPFAEIIKGSKGDSKMVSRIGMVSGLLYKSCFDGGFDHIKSALGFRRRVNELLKFPRDPIKNTQLSDLGEMIAWVVEELEGNGYPIERIPLNGGKVGIILDDFHHRSSDLLIVDGKMVDEIGKEINRDVFLEGLRNKKIIPNGSLILLALIVAPEICHVGNTYGYEKPMIEALGINNPYLQVFEGDYNHTPERGTGSIELPSSGGDSSRIRSLVALDLLHFTIQEYRELVMEAIKTGDSQYAIKYGESNSELVAK